MGRALLGRKDQPLAKIQNEDEIQPLEVAMKIKAFVVTLACLAVLLPELANADKLVRKSRDRKIPDGWCPLVSEDVLIFQFKATSSSATIRLAADNRPGQRIDNIYVVEKSVFEENLVDDDECNGGKTFDPLNGNAAVFVETFDSEANAPHLERFLSELASRSNARRIHLIAHSMGNRPLTAALRQIAAHMAPASKPLFDHVILTAPDMDLDTFRQIASQIARPAQRATLYASSG